jgi:hypothetical protein
MAMKKTSSGDSPLWQLCQEELLDPPDLGSTAAAERDVFWKSDRVFRFFSWGVFISEGVASEVDQGALTTGGRGPGAGRAPWWCGCPVAPLCLLFGSLEASVNFRMFEFCFVQF